MLSCSLTGPSLATCFPLHMMLRGETTAAKFSPVQVWLHKLWTYTTWEFPHQETEEPRRQRQLSSSRGFKCPQLSAKPKTISWRPVYWIHSQTMPSYLSGLSETKQTNKQKNTSDIIETTTSCTSVMLKPQYRIQRIYNLHCTWRWGSKKILGYIPNCGCWPSPATPAGKVHREKAAQVSSPWRNIPWPRPLTPQFHSRLTPQIRGALWRRDNSQKKLITGKGYRKWPLYCSKTQWSRATS